MVFENIYLFQADYSILDSVSDKSILMIEKMDNDITQSIAKHIFLIPNHQVP